MDKTSLIGKSAQSQSTSPGSFGVMRVVMLLLFFAIAAFIYLYMDTRAALQSFLLSVQEDRWGSLQLFVYAYTAAVPLMFPTMVLQVVSGALYGFWYGFWVSWIATSVGQTLAFILGRYLFRAVVKKYLYQTWPRFPVVDAAIKKSAWKLVCLLRLSPVLPYNILNYALGLTPVSFMTYTGASALASTPWAVLYVYLGTFSTNIVDLAQGKLPYCTDYKLLLSILSMGAIVITSIYCYIVSKRAIVAVLKDAEDHMSSEHLELCKSTDSVVEDGLENRMLPTCDQLDAQMQDVEAPLLQAKAV